MTSITAFAASSWVVPGAGLAGSADGLLWRPLPPRSVPAFPVSRPYFPEPLVSPRRSRQLGSATKMKKSMETPIRGDHLREEEPDQEVDHPQHEHADAHADPAERASGRFRPSSARSSVPMAGLHEGEERHPHEQQHQVAAEGAFRDQHGDDADQQQRGRTSRSGARSASASWWTRAHQGHADDDGDHGVTPLAMLAIRAPCPRSRRRRASGCRST